MLTNIVTILIEDTHFRIFHGEHELAVWPRKNTVPITRFYVIGMGTRAADGQESDTPCADGSPPLERR